MQAFGCKHWDASIWNGRGAWQHRLVSLAPPVRKDQKHGSEEERAEKASNRATQVTRATAPLMLLIYLELAFLTGHSCITVLPFYSFTRTMRLMLLIP